MRKLILICIFLIAVSFTVSCFGIPGRPCTPGEPLCSDPPPLTLEDGEPDWCGDYLDELVLYCQ